MELHVQQRRMVNLRHNQPMAYATALLIFAVALLCRFSVDDLLPPGFPYVMFIPAVIVSTFICGTRPGILVATLSFVAAWYFFLPPFNSFELTSASAIALAFFIFIAGIDLVIIDRLMRALDQIELERMHAVRVAGERDNMFREVQHRIGNNLQVISSLLLFQARNVTDPVAHRALIESMQRVSVVADIQRKFHDPDRTEGRIDGAFIDDLVKDCLKAAGQEATVDIVTDITPVTLAQDSFLAVSLVLTECVNNALEHGQSAGEHGVVRVSLTTDPDSGMATLSVSDNGPGLADAFDLPKSNSIGLKVVQAFTQQLNGTFAMEGGIGTICRLIFPIPDFAANVTKSELSLESNQRLVPGINA